MKHKIFEEMSRFGVDKHDLDPLQRSLLGINSDAPDDFLWPHLSAATLTALSDSPQEIPDHVEQQLRDHIEDCELCQSRLSGYSRQERVTGGVKLKDNEEQCVALGGELEIKFTEDRGIYSACGKWYIFHLGVTMGVWQIELKYDPAKGKLTASLNLPKVVGDWTRMEFSLTNYDLDDNGQVYLSFDKENKKVMVDWKTGFNGSWQGELYLYGRYPEWGNRVYYAGERDIVPCLSGPSRKIEIEYPDGADDDELAEFLSVVFHDHMGRPVIFKPEDQNLGSGLLLTPWGLNIGRVKEAQKDSAAGKLQLAVEYTASPGYLVYGGMDLESGEEENAYFYNPKGVEVGE